MQLSTSPARKFRVVILGGGSAGWMAAAYLSKALERGVEISLVESANIGTVGVGEATFSTIQLFFQYLGLREEDWMPHCNASYKMAIRFVDWNGAQRHFYHPFQRLPTVEGRSMAEWWLKKGYGSLPYDYACYNVPTLCDAKRAPRYSDGRVFDHTVDNYFHDETRDSGTTLEDLKIQYPYAYHFDASLLATFMSQYARGRGVRRIVADVTGVELDERGYISTLQTRECGPIGADLFIDCTGFRGVLINEALKEPFIPFSRTLLCDRAVAMQVPSDPEREGINPYTTATALSSGWVWNIPLFNRIGTGYVYSNAFLSPSAAEEELRRHLGKCSEGRNASHIRMRIGRNRNSWVKNCVAIGLSSAFVEPLESTGIFFIQQGIEHLVRYFPHANWDEQWIRDYNQAVAGCIDGVRDFLTLHYVASARQDTAFWKATKLDITVSDDLAERLRIWKRCLPNERTINPTFHGFESYSYVVMLLGLGYRPDGALPVLNHMNEDRAIAAFDGVKQRTEHLRASLPTHYEYLAQQRQAIGEEVRRLAV
jgi:flavin-dependent dehydrogenase